MPDPTPRCVECSVPLARAAAAGGRVRCPACRDRRPRRDAAPERLRSPVLLILSLLGCAGLLAAGVVAAGVALFVWAGRTDEEEPVAAAPPDPAAPAPPPPAAAAVAPRPEAATVRVRAFDPAGGREGSGFFVAPGRVLTNARVVGYSQVAVQPPTTIQVTVPGREPDGRTLPARVYGADVAADLALLAVEGDDLPPPLALGRAADLGVNHDVVLFGYPIEGQNRRAPPFRRSRVLNLRREGGRVVGVQVGGWPDSIYAGGPVANARDEVVAVLAPARVGETVAYAVPAETAAAFVADQLRSGGTTPAAGVAARPPAAPSPPPPAPPAVPVPPFPVPKIPPPPAVQPPRVRSPFRLPPRPDPVEITPAPVAAATRYALPEAAAAVRVGGGGRYLVLQFPGVRKLGLFDTSAAKIVRYVPVAEDDAAFAAGMTKLVVYLPGAGVVRRYDLATGEQEFSGPLALGGGGNLPDSFALGHASAGPLLAGGRGRPPRLYEIDSFKEVEVPAPDGRPGHADQLPVGRYWAGASGRVFGQTGFYGMPNGVRTVALGGGGAQLFGQHWGTWFVVPGPDDLHVYAGGYGVLSTRVQPVPNVARTADGGNSGRASQVYLPAAHGPYYFHLSTLDDVTAPAAAKVPVGVARVFALGDKEPIGTLPDVAFARYGQWEAVRGVGVENTVHLIPKARLLIVLPPERTELALYPFDPERALDATGRDYLLFTSSPPGTFRPGSTFAYAASVRAKGGRATVRLESGPPGMTVGADGAVRWAVPADFPDRRADVILAATSGSGREAVQSFTLTAADTGAR